ncbi:copper transport protein [Stackebrandtia endophytica]|uniref:Copper transport protein n=1 Tax=Stackebrandtia endophytica TaxID=1496996 RepID=A0A543AT93_9ACTN|nr:copper transport protein [Stackebrandtia endophytica]
MPRNVLRPVRLPTVLAVLGGLFLALLAASPAQAHATVVATTPAIDEIVADAPQQVTVEFSEPVSVVAAETGVIGPDGRRADAEPATSDGNVLTYVLTGDLPEGTYLVSYRVISADGHPVPGGFTFSIGKRSAAPDSADLANDVDPLVNILVVVNRFLSYAGLVLLLGPGLLMVAARLRNGEFPPIRGPRRLMTAGLGLLAATAALGLYLHVPYTAGSSLFGFTGPDVAMVVESRFGIAAMLRLLIVAAAIPVVKWLSRAADGPATRLVPAVLAVALAVTWPMSGHATTSPAPPLTMVSDTVHVLAMGMWLGGLVTLAVYLVRRSHTRGVRELLPEWSRWATWLVAALAVAGLAQALIEVGSVDALLETRYGQLVIAKIVLFGVVLLAAFFARRAVLRSDGSLLSLIRRVIGVELAVGVILLGVSAVLVQTVPASVAVNDAGDQVQADRYSVELTDKLFTLRFELEPAAIGDNTAHLYLYTPQGEPLEAVEWSASYGQPDSGIAPVGIGLALLSPNHVQADVALPSAGNWEFTFTIRISELERSTVSTVVTVG